MMGILGPGGYHAVCVRGDSRSSVLSLFYIVWKSFLESEKRHGIGVFLGRLFFISCHLTHMFLLLNQSTENEKKLSYSPPP